MNANHPDTGISKVLDSITDGFFILDSSWNFTYFNKTTALIFSISSDHLHSNFWEVFPRAKALKYWEAFNDALQTKKSWHFEEYAPDMRTCLEVNIHPSDEGLIVYFRDITEERKNKEKILADEENLRILINNTEDPIWAVDVNNRVLLCNNAFKKWISYFTGKELGKGDDLLDPGFPRIYFDKFEMCYKLAFSGRAFRSVEDYRVNDDLRYSAISFNPVFDKDKQVIGLSCFARDITEHRKHMFTIEAQNVVLRDIAFIQSHKVRGPVASILGLIQLFDHGDIANVVNQDIIRGVESAAGELDITIKEIVSKINSIEN